MSIVKLHYVLKRTIYTSWYELRTGTLRSVEDVRVTFLC